MNPTVLGPAWQLRPVDNFTDGFYPTSDAGWYEQTLPAHWQEHPELTQHTGNVVYRYCFGEPRLPNPKVRRWLRAAGIFYWSRIYLNGRACPWHEGYFMPQEHEVTSMLQAQNTLIIEVACPEERNKHGKRMITGVFSHWDGLDPATNPGGVWLPITIEESGIVRVSHAGLSTDSLGADGAVIHWSAEIDSAAAIQVDIEWSLAPATFSGPTFSYRERRVVHGGQESLAGSFTLPEPRLWWSHDLGRPDLYEATFEAHVLGAVSDTRSFRFGVRTFEMRDLIPYLNGVRFLAKGNNYAPGDTRIARMTPERAQTDVRLARECNMNMLRIHAHVDHPALYEAADEQGVLLWQDFPLQWLYRRSVLRIARGQVHDMLRLLSNHPSVVVWCMHNEPVYITDTSDQRKITGARIYFSVFVWSWNRDVMDQRLAEDARRLDPGRPVISNSGEYALPGWHAGNDSHFYFGWYQTYGAIRGFDWVRKRFPRNLRFVTEFGAQSFPNRESCQKFMPTSLEEIDWDFLARRHSFQPHIMEYWYDWRACQSLDELIELSQYYQLEINRFYIDRLRLHKYRPTGGIVPFMFADSNPAIQWSVLDYWRVPKASYWALRDAFRPRYAWTILDSEDYAPGEQVLLPIYVVNDARDEIAYCVRAEVRDGRGAPCSCIVVHGTLGADSLAERVARLAWVPVSTGTYSLHIKLESDGDSFENVYALVVRAHSTS